MKKLIILFLLVAPIIASAQHHQQKYFPVTDPAVKESLENWEDVKFGLLMHWGPYSQWGIVESWSICSEDVGWCKRKSDNYVEYKKEYENLQTTFNPTKFDPDKWAEAAAKAGMKYVVLTTKHHDGYCMFDSKFTDYKITDPKTPFSSNPKANVTREIFDSFRAKGLMAGAYFSKPDWHSKDYWWPNFATPDRNVNYDVTKYPDKWESFVQFTHNQIMELMTDYGKVDILWLDGGWVQRMTPEQVEEYNCKPGYSFTNTQNQDIRMSELAAKARKEQPGLIVVDRAVEGPNQNYLTPENTVPKEMLPYPWESCIIMGGGWSYSFNAEYKSGRELVHMLIDIVAKGGNLLLNVGPSPEGTWHPDAYDRLEKIGSWMDINSEAIYATRKIEPYYNGPLYFTEKKDHSAIYAIYTAKEGENYPDRISLHDLDLPSNAKVSVIGYKGRIKTKSTEKGLEIILPAKLISDPPHSYAICFRIQ
ncbi:MAG: alpha-L-fucosidase [Bacteroidetes bacterium]|jgi:alpha-L-fucosidase|nr:alpha-L-fucosidase [Bacteroidota bacterium]MBT3750553.1 alpha-L-fucosidase [Bacteroidota bacterium]MBT4399116.1 alpha-L-fucosidase [Bacteroidota bacterium]MBT4408921.1 alpha-L-fucosidase [Bacteroidota bacterium]MBT5428251.1 alpha-L-fucosidase [Bacteroidota bacterium]